MASLPSDAPKLTRIQENWLAVRERRILNWLCARMPASVTPDRLTALGMVGAVMVFAGYLASNLGSTWLLLSLAGYVIQWFGDSMDGSLARFRRIERPSYGYFIDHSCDGLANLLIVGGIGLSPFVTMDVAMVALAGYFLMSMHAFLSARVIGELRLSYLAAGPTELRLFLMGLTVAMMVVGPDRDVIGRISGFDLIVGAIGAILIVLFVVQTLSVSRLLLARGEKKD
ncbi:CDP-alcohol phosphatidyltransferase family protein [uncultured Sphingomonas sp.]|uniref:CDP-alcohol phosphatidyltransferase family protein n=1 Tax=uncultured Sphingomonas sp. TaxID=158754 RepID=UPI0025DC483D|nr:CDP-alcohol phosphatidyltransferase family protein [uncultured Sphingomonas sp.]